jgi:HEAT repeat protein/energy-coupling factor transporter ATP-binding protein EcfA2
MSRQSGCHVAQLLTYAALMTGQSGLAELVGSDGVGMTIAHDVTLGLFTGAIQPLLGDAIAKKLAGKKNLGQDNALNQAVKDAIADILESIEGVTEDDRQSLQELTKTLRNNWQELLLENNPDFQALNPESFSLDEQHHLRLPIETWLGILELLEEKTPVIRNKEFYCQTICLEPAMREKVASQLQEQFPQAFKKVIAEDPKAFAFWSQIALEQILSTIKQLPDKEDFHDLLEQLETQLVSPTLIEEEWRTISQEMLRKQRNLTTNLFTNPDVTIEVKDVYTPLAIMERKEVPKQPDQSLSAEEGSQQYREETVTPITEEKFLEALQTGRTQKSQGRRIVIIGEAGSGKTTRLQVLADWILEKRLGLPIWVSLRDLEGSLSIYLEKQWLQKAGKDKYWEDLKEQFNRGKVWLLLDGLDELSSRAGESEVENLLTGFTNKARVVLTCRSNVWDVGVNAFSGFDVYRNRDFEPAQVKEYIGKWFASAGKPEAGERLHSKLEESGRERLRDLIRNPLRLSLLCLTWNLWEGELPNTQAGLYQQFVKQFYKWKSGRLKTKSEERKAINKALADLALQGMLAEETSGTSRFRLKEEMVEECLGEYFEKVLDLGWINCIGRAEEDPLENVYAFYHATFQEYFGACAIDDWDFFLPRQHRDRPVRDENGEYKRYRVFESRWKQVIILWFGRREAADKAKEELEKKKFLKKLLDFEEGCLLLTPKYYQRRGHFLITACIPELSDYSWTFPYPYDPKTPWVNQFINYIVKLAVVYKVSEAQKALKETDIYLVNQALLPFLQDEKYDLRRQAAKELQRTSDPNLISNLLSLLQHEDAAMRATTAEALQGTTDPKVLQALVPLLQDQSSLVRSEAAQAFQGTSNSDFLFEIVPLLSDKDFGVRWAAAEVLQGTTDPKVISQLLFLLKHKDSGVRRAAAEALQGTTDREAIQHLILILQDQSIEVQGAAAKALQGNIDCEDLQQLIPLFQSGYHVAIKALQGTTNPQVIRELVALLNDENIWMRVAAAEGLQGTTNREALLALIPLLQDKNWVVRSAAAKGLKGTNDSKATRDLVVLLSEERSWVRAAAAEGLQGTTNREALLALIPFLKDDSVMVSKEALKALQKTKDPEILKALIPLLEDEQLHFRVKEILLASPDPELIKPLIHLTKINNDNFLSQIQATSEELLAKILPYPDFYEGWYGENNNSDSDIVNEIFSWFENTLGEQ